MTQSKYKTNIIIDVQYPTIEQRTKKTKNKKLQNITNM